MRCDVMRCDVMWCGVHGVVFKHIQGDCNLVIGISPSIVEIDIEGSLTNSPFNKLRGADRSSGGAVTGGAGDLSGGSGCFHSALNHFQDCVDQEGALVFSRLPQQRPNVVLLVDNHSHITPSHSPCPSTVLGSDNQAELQLESPSQSQTHSQSRSLYNFSLPFWSFLHRHPLTDGVLPTDTSEVLDSTPLKLHSLFTELCNSMLFLLRKMTHIRELDMMKESSNSAPSALMEPVAATLKVLLALENQVSLHGKVHVLFVMNCCLLAVTVLLLTCFSCMCCVVLARWGRLRQALWPFPFC